jgi:hypothetical protein
VKSTPENLEKLLKYSAVIPPYSEDANISYILSEGDNIIIESNQSYSTTSEFDTDIEYIILQIEKIFM